MQPNFEEILNTIVMGNKDWSNTICSKEQAIEAMQEVWNKALEAAAESAETTLSFPKDSTFTYRETIVDKQSILKLKL